MGVFPSTASHSFLTSCPEVCSSEEEEGESTFLCTNRDGGGGQWVKGGKTTKIKDHNPKVAKNDAGQN